ncbi:MAG TPA: hypothetical protein ENH57_03625 [Actinobacteria bacterium]|nr:hypothetical protein [Actinomycetota bacterium]
MKVALITRIKEIIEQKEIDKFSKRLSVFQENKHILKIYIISDQLSISKLPDLENEKIEFIPCDDQIDPTSPTSLNLAIKKLSKNKIDAFIVASRQFRIETNNLDELITKCENDKKLLVAGYKFKIEFNDQKPNDEPRAIKLNNELQSYYQDKTLIAYQAPWNTCAIWNYELFKEYIKKFDGITKNKSGRELCVRIDNVCRPTAHKGMEDGLAIAKATKKDSNIKFKLFESKLIWEIEKSKIFNHRLKLARKEIVMRNFMKEKGYSEKTLLNGLLNSKNL